MAQGVSSLEVLGLELRMGCEDRHEHLIPGATHPSPIALRYARNSASEQTFLARATDSSRRHEYSSSSSTTSLANTLFLTTRWLHSLYHLTFAMTRAGRRA